MLRIVHDADGASPEIATLDPDELCRLAAREMLAVALEAERRAHLDAHAAVLDEAERRLVVGNGYAERRVVITGAGMVEVSAADPPSAARRALQIDHPPAPPTPRPEGDRGAAAALPARPVERRLRPGAGILLRF